MADVYLNGKKIGKTNVDKLTLPVGTHSLKFSKGGKSKTVEVTIEPGENSSKLIKF